jgi:hypothetical protein
VGTLEYVSQNDSENTHKTEHEPGENLSTGTNRTRLVTFLSSASLKTLDPLQWFSLRS